jgi:hypothetical protein
MECFRKQFTDTHNSVNFLANTNTNTNTYSL